MISGNIHIKRMKIKELCPATYNPRKDLQPGDPQYDSLMRSMKNFGYVDPIVYNNRTGRVVGGHQRLKIFAAEGVTEADCVVVDLSEKDEKTLNIALNKIHGEWDMDKLEEVMRELADEAEAALTGFSQDEIDMIVADVDDIDVDSFFTPSEPKEKENPKHCTVCCPECGCEFEP